jgi:hypothetical protein
MSTNLTSSTIFQGEGISGAEGIFAVSPEVETVKGLKNPVG